MESSGVRPLGLLEKLYTARHSLGLYNSITVLNTYRSEKEYTLHQLEILLSTALSHVVRQHAALCYGIHGESSKTPSYVPVDTIDLTQKLQFRPSSDDDSLMQQLESEHDIQWVNQETTPPWKLIVFQKEGDSKALDVAFVYHHALADGLSGAAFHAALFNTLREMSSQPRFPSIPTARVEVSNPPSSTPPIEELVKFNISWGFLVSQVLQEYGPRSLFGKKNNHFAGLDCEVSDRVPFRTKLRLLEIDSDTLKPLLAGCKSRKILITSLLTVVLVRSLALAVPDAEAFIGGTPYTLRRVSGTDYQVLVNQTSALETEYETGVLNCLRDLKLYQNTSAAAQTLWLVAEEESTRLHKHIATCLSDNVVGLLPYVSDHHNFYRKKLGKKREQTFEVSNLGPTKPYMDSYDSWKVERAIFTQGAAAVGPALALNVASVADGPLNITFSWQENIIEEKVVASTVALFETTLKALVAASEREIP